MYISQDPLMLGIVDKIKENQKVMGKNKLKNTSKDYKYGDTLLKDLGITESDKQNIFDIIEMDFTEYD